MAQRTSFYNTLTNRLTLADPTIRKLPPQFDVDDVEAVATKAAKSGRVIIICSILMVVE